MSEDAVTDLTRGVYRRIYAGYIFGERINKLSLSAEAWFWRVYMAADDFGNERADPELCKIATAGPRKVSVRQVSGWLREMRNVGLIEFYTGKNGEPLLHILDFEESQPAGKNGKRIKKFPFPGESGCIQVNPGESGASHNHTHSEDDNDPQAKADNHTDNAQAPPFSSGEFLSALSDFEQHRKEIRHKLTPKAREAMYVDFVKWGERKSVLAIRESIRNGWRGVFEPKEDKSNASNLKSPSEQGSSASDYHFKSKTVIR